MTSTDQAAPMIKFIYVTTKKGRRATIAYQYHDDADYISVAVAECSTRDQFIKRIGRAIASGRLLHNGGVKFPYDVVGGTSYSHIAKFLRAGVNEIINIQDM